MPDGLQYGALGLLAIVLLGLWYGARWFAKDVMIPIRDGHLQYLKSTSDSFTRIAETQIEINHKTDIVISKLKPIEDFSCHAKTQPC